MSKLVQACLLAVAATAVGHSSSFVMPAAVVGHSSSFVPDKAGALSHVGHSSSFVTRTDFSGELAYRQPTQDKEKTAAGKDQKGETSQTKDPKDVSDLTFDDIKFDIEVGAPFKRELLGQKIEDLNGKTIRIKGFIRPSFRQDGITKFVFVRDNQECCFGPGAAIYDCILVELGPEQSTEFTVRPITVKGEFFLKEYQGPDGNIWAIFRMKNGVVE